MIFYIGEFYEMLLCYCSVH